MPELPKYEQQHYANMDAIERAIQKLYDDADFEIITFVKATFRGLKNYTRNPLFKKKLKDIESKLHDNILSLLGTGVQNADKISATKSKAFIQALNPSKKAYEILLGKEFNTTAGDASKYFTQRRKQGFDISARVWDVTGQKKAEIADSVGAAIDSGVSADKLSKEIKKYLKEPDKVFRRVRDANGKLVESQARKDYHPGQGVYKSSKANAMRLSRTEINGAYKMSDQERWAKQDFVIGYRVKLSNNGKHCDFCEAMQGDYPKTFKWFSWHPQCRCSCTPILLTKEQYSRYEDYLLGLDDRPTFNYIEDLPANASEYIRANAERIKAWKTQPYWVAQNPDVVNNLLKKKKKAA